MIHSYDAVGISEGADTIIISPDTDVALLGIYFYRQFAVNNGLQTRSYQETFHPTP